MAELVLGPMVRYVGTTEATVWVETDASCEVEILGRTARTFRVRNHHYALVVLDGLAPDSSTEYEVQLDGVVCWPQPVSGLPAPHIRTLPESGPLTLAFGSCCVTAPHEPPYTLSPDDDERGLGVDALYALTQRLRDQDRAAWPQLLLLLGDQVYADELPPQTRKFVRARRDGDAADAADADPGEEAGDFEEFAWLYREAWSPAAMRWLLSTLPTAMIFDDHDVTDDWNISDSWVRDMRAKSWWQERIVAALASYWIYQHLGNLSPAELEQDELFGRIQATDDAWPILHAFALQADRDQGGRLWSYSRELAGTRLLVVDSREGRVLDRGGRQMIDDGVWSWLSGELDGEYEHVVFASTLPVLLAPTLHYIEAWNEALCDGAWGRLVAHFSEKLRRGLDMEHWAAFQHSFHRLIEILAELAAGKRGRPPASIVLLGGDVHQTYVEQVGFRSPRQARSVVYQVVCSPFRHQLARRERNAIAVARRSRFVGWLVRKLAHGAGVRDPGIRWRLLEPPTYNNQIGLLRIDGEHMSLTLECTEPGGEPELRPSLERQLV
jgi:PhoD-like phosphatase